MSEQSNEEIRERIAPFFGWKLVREEGDEQSPPMWVVWSPRGCEGSKRYKDYAIKMLPDWTGSMDAALTLCDRLREEGWEAVLTGKSMKTIWYVEFKKYLWGSEVCHRATDPSLPRAICLAFLKAHPSP